MGNFFASGLGIEFAINITQLSSIISAALVIGGQSAIQWQTIIKIAIALFTFPILSLLIATLTYWLIARTVIEKVCTQQQQTTRLN